MAGEGIAFVCPQFELRNPDVPGWHANIDFVVLQLLPGDRSRIVVIEVSDDGGLGSVATGAANFKDGRYRELVRLQVAEQANGLTSDWDVHFLGFVRTNELVKQAEFKFNGYNRHFRSLEQAFCVGWWDIRTAGLLPAPTTR